MGRTLYDKIFDEHVIHTEEDGLPKFSARFRQWSTRIREDAIPEFVPPEGAERVEVVPVTTR